MVTLKGQYVVDEFQCSSASRKFLNNYLGRLHRSGRRAFQCSSASRKFLNRAYRLRTASTCRVSVLFSEPKIPQSLLTPATRTRPASFQCSSASRKFLNSEIDNLTRLARFVSVLFSEPKIPQYIRHLTARASSRSFSALQRAENSSIAMASVPSPSRRSFSALQRAENSSIQYPIFEIFPRFCVSVLFSEPKIPQSGLGQRRRHQPDAVSVLFSEPKIPQS